MSAQSTKQKSRKGLSFILIIVTFDSCPNIKSFLHFYINIHVYMNCILHSFTRILLERTLPKGKRTNFCRHVVSFLFVGSNCKHRTFENRLMENISIYQNTFCCQAS